MKVTSETETCPSCGSSWIAGEIPEKDRHHFGNKTHFSHRIAIYDRDLDRTVSYMCPFCKEEFPRD